MESRQRWVPFVAIELAQVEQLVEHARPAQQLEGQRASGAKSVWAREFLLLVGLELQPRLELFLIRAEFGHGRDREPWR